jgi:hypothetical protein
VHVEHALIEFLGEGARLAARVFAAMLFLEVGLQDARSAGDGFLDPARFAQRDRVLDARSQLFRSS